MLTTLPAHHEAQASLWDIREGVRLLCDYGTDHFEPGEPEVFTIARINHTTPAGTGITSTNGQDHFIFHADVVKGSYYRL